MDVSEYAAVISCDLTAARLDEQREGLDITLSDIYGKLSEMESDKAESRARRIELVRETNAFSNLRRRSWWRTAGALGRNQDYSASQICFCLTVWSTGLFIPHPTDIPQNRLTCWMVDNIRSDFVQKCTIVRNHKDCARVTLKVVGKESSSILRARFAFA
jgi:hypothetical protein